MKLKLTLFLLYVFAVNYIQAQSSSLDNYQGRLYMTCKVWGFVKYHHSRISVCQLNWDSVLIATIPQIKAATDGISFNTALLKMLKAAGPMKIATTPPPFIDPTLAINVDNKWMGNLYLSDSVRTILDTIKNNFRPHAICYVKDNDYTDPNNEGWLLFPGDSVTQVTSTYPTEPYRLFLIFKYWNIIHYFNPYNTILDTPWDSTLYKNVLSAAQAKDKSEFYKVVVKMASKLDDAHVYGLTWSRSIIFPKGYNFPKLVLKYADNKYVISKSEEAGIKKGDIILTVDGLTTQQWEDSLRPYVSAGNPSVFRREMCNLLLRGTHDSIISIIYEDSLGIHYSKSAKRSLYWSQWWDDFTITDTITKWKTIGCNTGYVHMGNLIPADVPAMYDSLKNKPAIIFDIRNYPNETAWDIANKMLKSRLPMATFQVPDVTYPGTYLSDTPFIGQNNNPTPYNGKVIILMNEETQSQAEYSCMILSLNKEVVKIGSQTAGADGNITYFNISSDLQCGFTTLGVFYPNGDSTQRKGIVPDILLNPTIAGVRHGIDEVLEKAIAVACATGIEEVKDQLQATLYPNPARDHIFLHINGNNSALSIRVMTIFGQSVHEEKMSGSSKSIDVSAFAEGLYFLSISDKEGNILKTVKVIKE